MATRRSAGTVLIVVAAILAAIVLFLTSANDPPNERSTQTRNRIEPRVGKRTTTTQTATPEASQARNRSVDAHQLTPAQRQRQAQIRAQIIAAAQAREAAQPVPEDRPEPELEPEPGQLTKRVEGHEALHAELNRDAMPLIHECITAAQKRQPDLDGMLAVGFEIVADEDLGAIIDDVAFPEQNEVEDPELHECVHATLMSMLLPTESENGRSKLMLTLPIEPESASSSTPQQ